MDVGGSHVKMLLNGELAPAVRLREESDTRCNGRRRARADGGLVAEVVSVGVRAPGLDGPVLREPVNLGKGWVGFDFEAAFGRRRRS